MNRQDYEEIKGVFERFISNWCNRNTDDLCNCFVQDVKCYMGTCKDSTDGGRHSVNGVTGFVNEMTKCSHLHMNIYNFLCRAKDEKAYMTAIVTGVAATAKGEWKTCEFDFMFANSLIKTNDGWKINEMRFDLTDTNGEFKEFMEPWFIGEPKARWFEGVHLPMICGDLDNVWVRIKECEEVLTEVEQIYATFSRYAFGIDAVSFQHLDEAFSDDLVMNMAPFGSMDKRCAMQTLKFHRQPDKYWIHPAKVDSIEIDRDEAKVRLYRMAGHRQRHNPLILTAENIDNEHACARYELKMRKENGQWRINRLDYFLGILDVGPYENR